MLLGSLTSCHSSSRTSQEASGDELKAQIRQLAGEVEQLKQEQRAPGVLLNRYRNSVGYIYGVYDVGFSNRRPQIRTRVSGTGFLVGNGLLVTNRHVAEPWNGDEEAKRLMDQGAIATIEKLMAFFPNSSKPVRLLPGVASKTCDLAVLRTDDPDVTRTFDVLPLATSQSAAGQPVMVIGYPLGSQGMVAKSPSEVYERLAYRQNEIETVSKLAEMLLIRPSATYGHLGDIEGDKIVYDAPSAHGSSGGPVLNFKGEVIGVNTGYITGLPGGTFGVSSEALKPLLEDAKKKF